MAGLLLVGGNAGAADLFKWLGGAYCPASFEIPAGPVFDSEPEEGDIQVSADFIDMTERGASHLQGNVELVMEEQQARADEVFYDEAANDATLTGDVKFWSESLYLNSETAHVKFDDDTGTFTSSQYYLPNNQGRGGAEDLFIDPGDITSGENMDYTTCVADSGNGDFEGDFWKITADKLVLNHETERGSGRNIVLRIKDIPLFYAPYMTFPLNDKRKSGFLTPGVGKAGGNGFETRLPYYWNISPNMDATITPRVFSDSGFMGMVEYRYLFDSSAGRLNLEYLPGDNQFSGRDRSLIGFEHSQTFLDRGKLSLVYNRVSDPEYLEDFGAQLAIASTRFLPRRADLSYRGNKWNLSARMLSYQVVDRGIAAASRPYKNLPRVQFKYAPLSGNKKINLRLTSELTYFDRTDETEVTVDVTGFRADIYPSISYPIRSQSAFIIPKVGVHHTQYSLARQGPFKENPSRTIPIVSLDSGLFLERGTAFGGRNFLHTLEPRLYYLYVPHEDQTDLPVFDSSNFNLDYNVLFRENRFTGLDRVGDSNQVTLAVGSRLINRDTGKQFAYFRVAQSFYLEDQDVIRQRLTADGRLTDIGMRNTNLLSPVVVEAGANISDDLTLGAEIYWDPNDNVTRKMTLTAQYNPVDSKVINMAYRVRRAESGLVRRLPTDIEQSDVSFSWPVTDKLNAVGRWNYAVTEGRSLDLFAGLEYEGCCFALKAVGRRFLTNLKGEFNNGFFIQFELKGLGSLGARTADFLYQTIPGYGDGLRIP